MHASSGNIHLLKTAVHMVELMPEVAEQAAKRSCQLQVSNDTLTAKITKSTIWQENRTSRQRNKSQHKDVHPGANAIYTN